MADSPGNSAPYQFHFVAAPDDLAPYVNSLYVWRTDLPTLKDVMPAYSGQLVVFARGSGTMRFESGDIPTNDSFVLAPLTVAHDFMVRGPALMIGVSLNFRGWTALTGLDVSQWHDGVVDPEIFLSAEQTEHFCGLAERLRSGDLDEDGVLQELAEVVRQGIHPLPEAHATVIDRTLDWLSSSFRPEVEDLYEALPYSERQVQRLVARFFGQSPVRLARRYRAVRAATILSMPHVPPEIEAEIREAFYDQAHLIKEIRFFTGRTPRLLVQRDTSVVTDMLGPEGYSSVDLFGGNQDEQLGRADSGP